MLGEKLREERNARNLTQVQVAEKLGVKKQSVCNWENDNVPPSVEMLRRLAVYYSCSVDSLLDMDTGRMFLDATGLTRTQHAHVQALIDDLRETNDPQDEE